MFVLSPMNPGREGVHTLSLLTEAFKARDASPGFLLFSTGEGGSEWLAGPKDGKVVASPHPPPPSLCAREIPEQEHTSITYTHLCLNP